MQAAGTGKLKLSGIALIISSALYILLYIISFAIVGAAAGAVGAGALGGAVMIIGIIFAAIFGGGELVAGIIAFKNADKPEKAGLCKAWGIVVIVVAAILFFMSLSSWLIIFPIFFIAMGIVQILGASQLTQPPTPPQQPPAPPTDVM